MTHSIRRIIQLLANVTVRPLAHFVRRSADLLDHADARLTEPYYRYQPNPGRERARRRTESTLSRLGAIQSHIPESARSVLDIGCNTGFMSVSLSAERLVVGTESSKKLVATATNSARSMNCGNVAFIHHVLTPDSVKDLPVFDAVLFLGVWHHLPKSHSLEESVSILSELWQRTNVVLYFEAGDGPAELLRQYLNLKKVDATSYLYRTLLDHTCPGSLISEIGAFSEGESRRQKRLSQRPVFSVTRVDARHSDVMSNSYGN